jgi:hypothetical protein
MADVAKSGTPSLASVLPPANQKINGLLCGEDIAAGDLCYIKSDGKIWRSTGAAANAAAEVVGMALLPAKVAQADAVTLIADVAVQYGSGLTPGAKYYLSGATAGALADAASTGGVKPIAFAIDTTRIFIMRSRY